MKKNKIKKSGYVFELSEVVKSGGCDSGEGRWKLKVLEKNTVVQDGGQTHLPSRLLMDLAILLESEATVVAFFVTSLNTFSIDIMGKIGVSPKPFFVKLKTDGRRNSMTRGFVPAPDKLTVEQQSKGVSIIDLERDVDKQRNCLGFMRHRSKKKIKVLALNGAPITSDVDLLALGTLIRENKRRYDNPYIVRANRPGLNVLPKEDPRYGNICTVMRSILMTQQMLVELSKMKELIMHNVESDNPYAKQKIDFPVTLVSDRRRAGKLLGMLHYAFCYKGKRAVDMYVIRTPSELKAAVIQLKRNAVQVRLHPAWKKSYRCLRGSDFNGCYTLPRALQKNSVNIPSYDFVKLKNNL